MREIDCAHFRTLKMLPYMDVKKISLSPSLSLRTSLSSSLELSLSLSTSPCAFIKIPQIQEKLYIDSKFKKITYCGLKTTLYLISFFTPKEVVLGKNFFATICFNTHYAIPEPEKRFFASECQIRIPRIFYP